MWRSSFHPAVASWFDKHFSQPTEAQQQAWPAIRDNRHTLIAAPTGSGKTLAAFLAVLDELVRDGLDAPGGLPDETRVLYISPLKALSNDIDKNLQAPLYGIADELLYHGRNPVTIRTAVRTGDTPASERRRMSKTPPHILVTTPESLFLLLTSDSGRRMLGTVRRVIVDEIHALAPNKRGAHLSLSLERLQALCPEPLIRVGLSATQQPIGRVAQFLLGNRDEECVIVDRGFMRDRDLDIEVPDAPLEAVMANEVWATLYDRLAELARAHTTVLIFVNNRRLAERAARHLSERLDGDRGGASTVAAHHGSLAREHRLEAEERLKAGHLKVMVATASLELGIDIGDIDLVCQIGSPRSIATLLQRIGRAGHSVGGISKARLFPVSRDDLVECVALLDAAGRGELDELQVPEHPLDVLAQHMVAECACAEWREEALFQCFAMAYPYRTLQRPRFGDVATMLADGYSTRRGRRGAYLYRDSVNGLLRGRRNARLTALMNAGAIPDQFDYDVVLEPDAQYIGSLNEDFAFESLPGDIFQLGNTSYKILKIESGRVRVEDAQGQPPTIPFWFGEAPGRSDELSGAVSRLREDVQAELDRGLDHARDWLCRSLGLAPAVAVQLLEYLAAARAALNELPTRSHVVFERFFDEAGDQHLVIHSPFGARLNRAWGLALRKRFCRKFNFELQAAATEDSIVISLGATHSFPLPEIAGYLKSESVTDVVTQAMLAVPLFMTRWRWCASIALAIQRNRNGKRVPAQFQRMDAEDLVAVVFPDQIACQDNIVGEREIPDHPLVNQTIDDCLRDAMDVDGLRQLLADYERGAVRFSFLDLTSPSPLAQEILVARPYAFLDDAPAEERRTQAVNARRFASPAEAAELQKLSPQAIERVREEARPLLRDADEVHDALWTLAYLTAAEGKPVALLLDALGRTGRAARLESGAQTPLWVCAERLPQWRALFADARPEPAIESAGPLSGREWDADQALVDILRSRLEATGPVAESTLAAELGLDSRQVNAALLALQQEGCIMQGHFDPEITELQWCERGLLARIHRYTLQSLREQIEPVDTAAFMRFLFEWHGMGEARGEGEGALLEVLGKLEGCPVQAAAWESQVLPDRLSRYAGVDLDALCNSGQLIWLRPGAAPAKAATSLKTTPIMILTRNRSDCWPRPEADEPACSAGAGTVLECLRREGAMFFVDIVRRSGLLRTQAEQALAELAAAGLVHSDNFAGLRALITPASKRRAFHSNRRRGIAGGEFDRAGRWTLVPPARGEGSAASGWLTTDYETLGHVARVLLRRYGVVFRKLLQREQGIPPWRELLYVYRRLEARGEIRGGRFVGGHAGDQFALPEAVAVLRRERNRPGEQWAGLGAADPLNLSGVILPGSRVPASGKTRLAFLNGRLVGRRNGRDTWLEETLDERQRRQAQQCLLGTRGEGDYLRRPRHRPAPRPRS